MLTPAKTKVGCHLGGFLTILQIVASLVFQASALRADFYMPEQERAAIAYLAGEPRASGLASSVFRDER